MKRNNIRTSREHTQKKSMALRESNANRMKEKERKWVFGSVVGESEWVVESNKTTKANRTNRNEFRGKNMLLQTSKKRQILKRDMRIEIPNVAQNQAQISFSAAQNNGTWHLPHIFQISDFFSKKKNHEFVNSVDIFNSLNGDWNVNDFRWPFVLYDNYSYEYCIFVSVVCRCTKLETEPAAETVMHVSVWS